MTTQEEQKTKEAPTFSRNDSVKNDKESETKALDDTDIAILKSYV
jgi:hypothetical protein